MLTWSNVFLNTVSVEELGPALKQLGISKHNVSILDFFYLCTFRLLCVHTVGVVCFFYQAEKVMSKADINGDNTLDLEVNVQSIMLSGPSADNITCQEFILWYNAAAQLASDQTVSGAKVPQSAFCCLKSVVLGCLPTCFHGRSPSHHFQVSPRYCATKKVGFKQMIETAGLSCLCRIAGRDGIWPLVPKHVLRSTGVGGSVVYSRKFM